MINRPSMYNRPAKPLALPVKARDWRTPHVEVKALAEPVTVHAGSECHVTPEDVAERMAVYAGALCERDVLEPSAGTGNLARAILARGCDINRLTMIEMHTGLANRLQSIKPAICADFLEWATTGAPGKFDAIIMNPPFSKVRAHVSAAVSLLADEGVIIALVPITYTGHNCNDLEHLSEDTFSTAKVRTKIIEIQKSR